MASHDISKLIETLGDNSKSNREQAAAQIVAIGMPVIATLVNVLCIEPCGSVKWDSADAALCQIVQAPTRKEIRSQRAYLIAIGVGSLAAAALFFAIGLGADIGLVPSLILGLIVGYRCWAGVLAGSSFATWEGWDGALIFL